MNATTLLERVIQLNGFCKLGACVGKTKLARARHFARLKRIARQLERHGRDTGAFPNKAGHRAKLKSGRGFEAFERTLRRIDEFVRFKPKFPGDRANLMTGDVGIHMSTMFVQSWDFAKMVGRQRHAFARPACTVCGQDIEQPLGSHPDRCGKCIAPPTSEQVSRHSVLTTYGVWKIQAHRCSCHFTRGSLDAPMLFDWEGYSPACTDCGRPRQRLRGAK